MKLTDLLRRALANQRNREIGYSAAILIINLGLAYGSSAFLAHMMGVEQFGLYSFVIAIVTIMTIPSLFGLPTLVAREIAAGVASGTLELVKGLIVRSRQFVTAVSALMIVFALGAMAVGSGLGIWKADPTYLWAIPLVTIISWSAITAASLRGLGRVVQSQWPEQVLRPLLLLVLSAAFLILPGVRLTPATAAAATVLAAIVALGVNLLQWQRARPEALAVVQPKYTDRRWAVAVIPMAMTVGMLVLNAQIGLVLVGVLASHQDVALFKVATQTAQLCALGYTAVVMNVAPRIAAAAATKDTSQMKSMVGQGAVLATLFSLPPALIMILFGGPLLALLFSEPFRAAGPALAIMAGGQVINAAFGCGSVSLNMSGHERECAKAFALGLVVQLAASLALIPLLGLNGAAIASVLGVVASNVTLWRMAKTRIGIDTGVWAWRP